MQTTHMEHILAFEVRCIAPTQYLNRHIILTLTYKSTNFKFVVVVAALGVTDIFAVYPHICRAVKTIEMKEYIHVRPTGRQREGTAI